MSDRRVTQGRVLACFATLQLLFTASNCADPIQSVSADAPRRSAPVPACIYRLAPRGESQKTFVRQVTEPQMWRAVFSDFDDATASLPKAATACTRRHVFNDAVFDNARPRRGWPIRPQDGDIRLGGGPNRLKIAWFRTHEVDSGAEAGVIALLRGLEDYVEVYGIGTYQGNSEKTRLGTERIGTKLVVTAVSDGCQGVKPHTECNSVMHVYVPEMGVLAEQPKIDIERIGIVDKGEPGATGNVQYRLITTPRFAEDGIHLLEQIAAVDEAGHPLRQVELERLVRLTDSGSEASAASLWDRVVPRRSSSSQTEPRSEEAGVPGSDRAAPGREL